MKITFVNKNCLIPDIKEFTSLEDSLDKLYDTTFNQSAQYNENVYIVHCSKIYFRFNEKFYSLNTQTNNISIYNYNTNNNVHSLNIIKNFTNNNKLSELTELAETTELTKSEMKLVINNKTVKNVNINDTNENSKSNIKPVEKLFLLETINDAISATSSGSPSLASGIFAVMYANCSGAVFLFIVVLITAGASPFIKIPEVAYSLATPFTSPITPAFVDE